MTQREKLVYNTWLVTNKGRANKPFRYRKNFDNMDESTQALVKKINSTITRLKIPVEEFFVAPFELWHDTTYMPLDFYTKHKAVAAWKKIFANKRKDTII